MKREAASILCFLALLFSMATPVYGEDLCSVTAIVNSDKLVTISGRIDGGPGRPVNILVRDPNGSLEYMDTCLSGAGGIFNISYNMTNTLAGCYNVTVGTAGAANVAAAYFLYGKNIIEATAVLEDGLVRITGTTGAGAGQLITARITAPDSTEEYAGCAVSVVGGGFQLSYALTNTQTGKYTVYVGASGIEEPAVCYFLSGVKTEVKAKIDNQKLVTVEGVSASPGKPVSVQITDPEGKTEYLAGVLTKKDGTFAISYTMVNETKGYYTVSVSAKGLDTPVKTEFCYGSGLANLTLSNGSLSPVFNSETLSYSVIVNEDIAYVQVTPTAVEPTAIIQVNNAVVKSGTASKAISLNYNSNVISVKVTAADGAYKTYSVTITRNISEDNNLRGLSISRGTLSPSFSADTTSYTAAVTNSISSVKVTPTAVEPTAVILVNNTVVKSGAASEEISLKEGTNTITILVEAPSKAQKIYKITVIRDAPIYREPSKDKEPSRLSSNANLSGLTLNDAVLAPLFSSDNLNYTANVPYATDSVTVTPQTANGNATVKVNNIPVVSGSPSSPIPLNPGSNEISVVVTAENGTTKTYTVTVTRAVLYNVTVGSLSNGTIQADPTAAAAGATINLTITPEDGWQLKINTLKYNDGEDHLIAGTSFVMPAADVTVTAEFEQTASGNANLSDLTLTDENLNNVSLNEDFSPDILDYTANVNYLTASVTVTPTVEDSNSTVSVVNSGLESQNVMLSEGNNIITVTVTAEDGSTRTYTINVIRSAPDNAGLLDLAVSTQHPLSPRPFDHDRLSPNPYTVSVPYSIDSLEVIAIPVNLEDTLEVIAGNMEDDGSINLDVGANNIGIKVTSAADGSVKLYLLIVTREEISNDATLREILISNGTLTPEFDMDTISYSATVEASVSEITIDVTKSHPNADVTINGDRITNVSLNEGENTITILVTAEDDSTTKTYTLTVMRQSP
ncbi:MAG TPA: cadherin-like beta sandwich domain-containing protein [Bacillota bacterium]|nr:cadherin-like beta sandwich domain-containing protein [Bacillota bacterium]